VTVPLKRRLSGGFIHLLGKLDHSNKGDLNAVSGSAVCFFS